MKSQRRAIFIFLSVSAMALYALAAGGDASDPLVSLSYLNGTYTSMVDAQVNSRLDESDAQLLSGLSQSGSVETVTYADVWQETRLKQSDAVSGATGLNFLLLSGSGNVTFSSGAVVDVTAGNTVPSGTVLSVNHRYLVAEDTAASFHITSKTAVVNAMGVYSTALSDAVDYNAMAGALKTMHLFRGSFTGYGSGYDLEKAPTRLQALIMFIRVLGEEDAALGYTGATPFTDIAAGTDAAHYVGYAYSKGYTNGYTATAWKPAQTVNAYQYTEFLLRALGYSSTANTNLADTFDRAVRDGVLTDGEAAAMKRDTFLRAQLVYLSYYALDAAVSGSSDTLRDTLIAKGVFTASEGQTAQAAVTGGRM